MGHGLVPGRPLFSHRTLCLNQPCIGFDQFLFSGTGPLVDSVVVRCHPPQSVDYAAAQSADGSPAPHLAHQPAHHPAQSSMDMNGLAAGYSWYSWPAYLENLTA